MTNPPFEPEEIEAALSGDAPVGHDRLRALVHALRAEAPSASPELRGRVGALPGRAGSARWPLGGWGRLRWRALPTLAPVLAAAALVVGFWPTSPAPPQPTPVQEALSAKGAVPSAAVPAPSSARSTAPVAAAPVPPPRDTAVRVSTDRRTGRVTIAIALGALSLAVAALAIAYRPRWAPWRGPPDRR